MKQKIIRLAAVAGVLILAFIIYKIGPRQIWDYIKKLSVENFLILLALRILYWLLRTLNWKIILDAYEEKTSLFHLFVARMGGHAVSQLTPTAHVGSEATRIFMIKTSSKKVAVASVILDKTIEYLTNISFTALGVILIFTRIPLPGKTKTFFVGGAAIFVLFIIFILYRQKRGLLGWIVDFMSRIKIRLKFLEKNREKIKETDERISWFYRNHRGAFLIIFLLYSLLIMLWVTEIHLNLVFIGVTDISFLDTFLIVILGNLAFMFPFIPGSLGIYEATYIGLFALFGLGGDAALTLVLIRRLLALLLAGLGLLGMIKPVNK
jgi:uncharacterized protein (TIRG00374 family)